VRKRVLVPLPIKTGRILFGRKTYELLQAFWKDAIDAAETAPDPHVRAMVDEIAAAEISCVAA
jgi:hypothetical protein